MPNIGGPSAERRELLASVVTSRLLYAAHVWATRASKYGMNRVALGSARRLAALRVTRCYRTVSTVAALFFAEMLPADLLAIERETVRRRRKAEPDANKNELDAEAREATVSEWERRWADETTVAAWTRRVLLSVRKWIGRPPGAPVTYRLAQVLTGHGAYNGYLHRFGIITSPSCAHYSAPVNDAEHTLFCCPEWESTRTEMITFLGRRPGPNDVEEFICGLGPDPSITRRRRVLLDMFESIMKAKEEAEREWQRLAGVAGGPQRPN